jgi:hypothetical protein
MIGGMATYFTNVGPKSGPVRVRDGHSAIGILGSPDNNMPIGMALGADRTDDGLAIWRLLSAGPRCPAGGSSSIGSSA